MRCFRVKLLQRQSNNYYLFWLCVCSLSYPAYKTHAPYYIVICDLSGSTIFLNIISKGKIFRKKKLFNAKCVFWFSLHLWNISCSKNWARYFHIYIYTFPCKVPLFLSDFNKTWVFLTDFRQLLKKKIPWKSLKWKPSCCMRTDGQTNGRTYRRTDMMKLTVAFRSFAKST